jgi:hypothetical protein
MYLVMPIIWTTKGFSLGIIEGFNQTKPYIISCKVSENHIDLQNVF